MRKGLLLTLGVAVLVAMTSGAFAAAPVFDGVPGIINIGDEEGYLVYSDVFVFDDSVVDPDTPVGDLDWGFTQDADATGLDFIVNGLAAGSTGLNAAAPTFTIEEIGGGSGNSDEAAAYYAAEVAGVDGAATINVTADDGENVTGKTILVTVTAGGTDSVDDIGVVADGPIVGAYPAGWFHTDDGFAAAFVQAGMVFVNGATGYSMTTAPGGGLDDLMYGAIVSPFNGPRLNNWINVLPGKMYKVSTHVEGADVNLPTDVMYTRVLIGESSDLVSEGGDGGFGFQQILDVQNNDFTDSTLTALGGVDYEVIYEPPQDARFDGILYNIMNFGVSYRGVGFGPNWHSDVGVTADSSFGTLVFSQTTVEEFDIPGAGDQIGAWSASADFNSAIVSQQVSNDPGWKAKNLALTFLETGGQFDPTRYTLDSYTTNGVALPGTGFTLATATGSAVVSFLIGDVNWIDSVDTSVIPIADVQANGDSVWYRAQYSIAAADNTYSNNANVQLRLGAPIGRYANIVTIAAGDNSGPDTTPVVYSIWSKGIPASLWDSSMEDANNLYTGCEAIDVDLSMYGAIDPVDTFTIDNVVLETHPGDRY